MLFFMQAEDNQYHGIVMYNGQYRMLTQKHVYLQYVITVFLSGILSKWSCIYFKSKFPHRNDSEKRIHKNVYKTDIDMHDIK